MLGKLFGPPLTAMGKLLRWLYSPSGPPLRAGDFAKAAIFVLTVNKALTYAVLLLGEAFARAHGIVTYQDFRGVMAVCFFFMLAVYYAPYFVIAYRRLLCVTGRAKPSFFWSGVIVCIALYNIDFDLRSYLTEAALLLLLLPWKERWHAPEERTPEAAPGPAAPDGKAR